MMNTDNLEYFSHFGRWQNLVISDFRNTCSAMRRRSDRAALAAHCGREEWFIARSDVDGVKGTRNDVTGGMIA